MGGLCCVQAAFLLLCRCLGSLRGLSARLLLPARNVLSGRFLLTNRCALRGEPILCAAPGKQRAQRQRRRQQPDCFHALFPLPFFFIIHKPFPPQKSRLVTQYLPFRLQGGPCRPQCEGPHLRCTPLRSPSGGLRPPLPPERGRSAPPTPGIFAGLVVPAPTCRRSARAWLCHARHPGDFPVAGKVTKGAPRAAPFGIP